MVNLSSKDFVKSTIYGVLGFLFLLAFLRSYLRTNTTLTGYRLGELKAQEGALLEQRSHLRMKLAGLTTKQKLISYLKNE